MFSFSKSLDEKDNIDELLDFFIQFFNYEKNKIIYEEKIGFAKTMKEKNYPVKEIAEITGIDIKIIDLLL